MGTTYYVDGATGDDSDTGLTLGLAWATIGKANTTLTAGDYVFIRAGQYSETINPTNNGSAGNYISYIQYEKEDANIHSTTTAIDLKGNSYILIDGFKMTNCSIWCDMAENSTEAHHNIIRNCRFEDGTSNYWGIGIGGLTADGNAHHNKILNNVFSGLCNPDSLIKIAHGATYNLVEGNQFYYAAHDCLTFKGSTGTNDVNHNIARNNIFHAYFHSAIVVLHTQYNLIENNYIYDAGEFHSANSCGDAADRAEARNLHNSLQINSELNIIRKNEFINNGRTTIQSRSDDGANNNVFYNNTTYANYHGLYSIIDLECDENIVKNNIFYTSVDYEIRKLIGHADNNFYFFYNNVTDADIYFDTDGVQTLSWLEANRATWWANNLAQDPQFVNVSQRDLNIQNGSPMVDAGDWLTTITSATGSGTSFVVADARYFMDGWGMIDGDLIQLEGQTTRTKITDVNYGTNTITVESSISWTNGDGVALPYYGTKPNIGKY